MKFRVHGCGSTEKHKLVLDGGVVGRSCRIRLVVECSELIPLPKVFISIVVPLTMEAIGKAEEYWHLRTHWAPIFEGQVLLGSNTSETNKILAVMIRVGC